MYILLYHHRIGNTYGAIILTVTPLNDDGNLTILIPKSLKEQFRHRAYANSKTMGAVLREYIEKYVISKDKK